MPKLPHYTPELFKQLRKGYSKQNFTQDLMSGLIVGILALPLAIAFAIASGVGPEKGLYTAIIAGFAISFFGGSRFQIGGPTGAFIVIVYGIVAKYGYDGLATATLMAGVMLVIFGVAKLGGIIKFIPFPVTVGFTAGIAIIIALGQVPNFLGLQFGAGVSEPADAVGKIALYAKSLTTVNLFSVLIGVIALAICIVWPKITTKIPGSLIAIIVATLVVKILGWDEAHGVMTIGSKNSIPTGFPVPHLPNISLDMMRQVFQPALTIARDLTIPANMHVDAWNTVITVPEGVTLTVNGSIGVKGVIVEDGGTLRFGDESYGNITESLVYSDTDALSLGRNVNLNVDVTAWNQMTSHAAIGFADETSKIKLYSAASSDEELENVLEELASGTLPEGQETHFGKFINILYDWTPSNEFSIDAGTSWNISGIDGGSITNINDGGSGDDGPGYGGEGGGPAYAPEFRSVWD